MLLNSDPEGQSQISFKLIQHQIRLSMQKSRWLKSRLVYSWLTHATANKFTHRTFDLQYHYGVYGPQNVPLQTRSSTNQNMPMGLLWRWGILAMTRATFWTERLTLHYNLWDWASWKAPGSPYAWPHAWNDLMAGIGCYCDIYSASLCYIWSEH